MSWRALWVGWDIVPPALSCPYAFPATTFVSERIRYRRRHPADGAAIVRDCPHLHRARWCHDSGWPA